RLRSLLREAGAGPEVITLGPAGYRISLDSAQLDSRLFAQRADAARQAADRGDPAEAVTQAVAGLELWRGTALAELGDDFRAEVAALEERRLAALETLAEAGLSCGREREFVSWLGPQVARHPAHEHLRALLMLALYRTGRQAEALEAYRAGRRYLVEQLGLEPGRELAELQERILRHDPSLAPPSSGDVPARPDVPARRDQSVGARTRRRPSRVAAVVAVATSLIVGVAVWAALGDDGGQQSAQARTSNAPAVALLDGHTGRPRTVAVLAGAAPGLVARSGAG